MNARRQARRLERGSGLVRVLLALSALALSALALSGCQGECVQVCDRMAAVFARCGQPVSQTELLACRAEQAEASEVEERVCSSQTDAVLEENLRIRGGGDSPCVALSIYGDAAE